MVLRRQGNTWEGFLNGTLIPASVATLSGSVDATDGGDFTIGTRGQCHDTFGDGLIDDMRVYNRALSVDEILTLAGTGTEDSSGQGHHGTLGDMDPNPDWVGGIDGNALDFDGTNDYVSLDNSASLHPNSLTASAWIKVTGTTGDEQVIVRASIGAPYGYGSIR